MIKKIILGIETSCDETSAAILEQNGGRIHILSNIVASSASMHAKFGGIIPEHAAREQVKSMIPVIQEALSQANLKPENLDAIAVTYGPGLIGSLLVGVETAKVLSAVWQKPIIPVNHLIGHFYANWIDSGNTPFQLNNTRESERSNKSIFSGVPKTSQKIDVAKRVSPEYAPPTFPCVGLLVSGGHSDLVLFKKHGEYEYLGGTRDDAAGECFDKCARLLNLPYPGGPQISKLAVLGNPSAFKLPRPLSDSKDLDFSFSGLKTAVSNLLKQNPNASKEDLCASIEEAIIDSLIKKTITAVQTTGVEQLIVAGGVAANRKLTEKLVTTAQTDLSRQAQIHIPPAILCTDNGAMIASTAFFLDPIDNPLALQADPNLSLAY